MEFQIPADYLEAEQAKEQIKPRIKLHTFSSLGAVKPTDWLVKGFLAKNKIACIFGASGTCKSFLTLDMLLCVATGQEFHGMPVEQSPVLYICGEGGEGINKRLKAWAKEYNQQTNGITGFYMTERAIALNTSDVESAFDACEQIKEETGKYPLIAIDTFDRNFEGNENSSEAMSAFVTALTNLRRKTGSAVVVVHHTGKGDTKTARGSSVLRAGLDTEIMVTKDEHGNVNVENTKMKDEVDGGELSFSIKVIKVGRDEKYKEDITSLVLIKNKKMEAIKAEVKELSDNEPGRGLGTNQVRIIEAIKLLGENGTASKKLVKQHAKQKLNAKQIRDSLTALIANNIINDNGHELMLIDPSNQLI